MLSSQIVMTSDHQMETFQGKLLEVMGPLSRLWKGLEYIRKAPSDQTVEVPVEKFVALVEQVILFLGQTSLSVSYTRQLNILKLITKDPRKAKAILKENENILKENETHLFGKKFRSQIIETEKSRKKSLEVFKDFGEKKSPFENTFHTVKINRIAEGTITTRGNQVIETNINIVNSKVRFSIIVQGNFNIEVQQHWINVSFRNLKEVPFTNNSKPVPLTSMTLIHTVVRKLFTEEIPNVSLAGRLSQFVK